MGSSSRLNFLKRSLDVGGEGRMTTRLESRREGKPALNLPSSLVRKLKRMGLGGYLRRLKREMKGDSPRARETERLCPSTTKLHAVFDSISPSLDPKLVGSIVTHFWDSLYFAAALSEYLHQLARIKGRSRRAELRSLLEVIEEVALRGQRTHVEGLRRDIPRLLNQLQARNSHGSERRRTSQDTSSKRRNRTNGD
jgi:hypothetical protein